MKKFIVRNEHDRIIKNTLFGIRLKELRLEYGLTQLELANIMGTFQPNINRWENGSTVADIINFLKLCDLFDVSP